MYVIIIPGKRKQRKYPEPCQSHKYSVRKTPGFSPSHSCSVGKRLDPIESRQSGKRATSGPVCLLSTTGTHESYLIKTVILEINRSCWFQDGSQLAPTDGDELGTDIIYEKLPQYTDIW